MTPRWKRLMIYAPLVIVGGVLFVAIGGTVVRQLWNWLLPPLFGWHTITFWQAIGLLALCRILFGSWGWQTSGSSNYRRRMAERWERMTPEERERFQNSWRGRWGFGPPTGESTQT